MNGHNSQLTFLDLFCGCGGFSLGMERSGFTDWFQIPVARTHQVRAIGSAVPPLVREVVANLVLN